jgi:hypothetical protein
MRKQKQPYRIETILQLKDGSLYWKRWLYFRTALIVDIDTTSNLKWKRIFTSLKKNKI